MIDKHVSAGMWQDTYTFFSGISEASSMDKGSRSAWETVG